MAQRTQVLLAFTTQSIIHLHVIGEISGPSFAQGPDFQFSLSSGDVFQLHPSFRQYGYNVIQVVTTVTELPFNVVFVIHLMICVVHKEAPPLPLQDIIEPCIELFSLITFCVVSIQLHKYMKYVEKTKAFQFFSS